MGVFQTVSELENLVISFEECTLPPNRWNHAAHLAVALWYLVRFPEREATRAFITGLLRYNRENGIEPTDHGGYHETLTLFWLTIARHFQEQVPSHASLVEMTNDFILRFGPKESLYLDYYSEELIWSWRARQSWTEPDLKPIDA